MSSSLAARRRRRAAAPPASLTRAHPFAPAEPHPRSVAADDDIRILSAKHGLVSFSASLESNDTCFGQEGHISHDELARQAKALRWRPSAVIVLGGVHYVRAARRAFPEALALSGAEAGGADLGRQIGRLPAAACPSDTHARRLRRALPGEQTMRHVAFTDSAGVIRTGRRCPKSALPIGGRRHLFALHGAVSAVARLASDNETLLVPGVPEAKTDDEDPSVVVAFANAVETRLRGARVKTPQRLMRRLAARKLAANRLAIDLILDCERAASGRNGKRADPARWTEWRHYLRAAARSPAISRLAPLYHAIGDIEAALCER